MFNLPSYTGKVERIEVRKGILEATEVKEMLQGYGFVVRVERHCGMWLIHWTFPELKSVPIFRSF